MKLLRGRSAPPRSGRVTWFLVRHIKLIFLLFSAFLFHFGVHLTDTLFPYSTITFLAASVLIELLLSLPATQANGIDAFPSLLAMLPLFCACLAAFPIAFSDVASSLALLLVTAAVSCLPPLYRLARVIERRLAVDADVCGLRVLNIDLDSVLLTRDARHSKVLTISEGAVHVFSWDDDKFCVKGREVAMSAHPCLLRLASREGIEVKPISLPIPARYCDDGSNEIETLNGDVREKLLYQMRLWKDGHQFNFAEAEDSILIAVVAVPIALGRNAYSAIEDIANEGIRVVVWSRRPPDFVAFFVTKLRLKNDRIVTGSEWSQMPDNEKKSSGASVFAEFSAQAELVRIEQTSGGLAGVVSNQDADRQAMESADFGVKGGGDRLVPLFETIKVARIATTKLHTVARALYWIGVGEVLAVICDRATRKGLIALDRLLGFDCLVTICAFLSARFR